VLNFGFQAEELIKAEMLTMIHYDALQNPIISFNEGLKKGQQTSLGAADHIAHLREFPYETFADDILAQVLT